MMDAEIDAQVQKLTRLLDEAAYRTRRSRRSLERELGLAHGYLGNLFNGRTELKVYHVLLLSKLLHLDPIALLRQALHGEGGAPPAGAEEATASTPPARQEEAKELGKGLSLDLEELQNLVRQTFRDEVRKLGGDLAKLAQGEEQGSGE
jgi:hypothetical protein